jgi:hypothetical protein
MHSTIWTVPTCCGKYSSSTSLSSELFGSEPSSDYSPSYYVSVVLFFNIDFVVMDFWSFFCCGGVICFRCGLVCCLLWCCRFLFIFFKCGIVVVVRAGEALSVVVRVIRGVYHFSVSVSAVIYYICN